VSIKFGTFYRFIDEKDAIIYPGSQPHIQNRKMGLFNPQNREEQAHSVHCENARF